MAFLFRRRTMFMLLGSVLLLGWAKPRPVWFLVGLLLALSGEAIRIWAAGTVHKAKEVTTTGPYAWVRHPLYVGSFLIANGYFFMSGRWQAFLVGIPVFAALHWAAVVVEERVLRSLFGQEYEAYSQAVPSVVPRLSRPGLPPDASGASTGGFSWKRALYNREPFNIFCVTVISTLFAILMLRR